MKQMNLETRWAEICTSYKTDPDNLQYRIMFFAGALAFSATLEDDGSNRMALVDEIRSALNKVAEKQRRISKAKG